METTIAFTFGVLSVTAVILITAVAVGIVKVFKLEKQKREMFDDYNRRCDDLYREHDNQGKYVNERADELHREIVDVRSYIDRRFDKEVISQKQVIKG